MCTGLAIANESFYFGRNLDLEYDFNQEVVITPRRYSFTFTKEAPQKQHFAMIGMANATDGYPLYAEAMNEKGLGIAGLHFAGSGHYPSFRNNAKYTVSPYELIPWLLGQCATLEEARQLLEMTSLNDTPFSEKMPLAVLHWIIADKTGTLVAEPLKTGFKLYDNPTGVLTNDPPFDYHMANLNNFINLTPDYPENRFSDALSIKPTGMGAGGIGLPGDSTSVSRFVKAVFNKMNSVAGKDKMANISQFFHILDSVAAVRGTLLTRSGMEYITRYSCCFDAEAGIYYYKTYDNSQISAVSLFQEDLDNSNLIEYPLVAKQSIYQVN